MNSKIELYKLLNNFFDHIYLITLKRSKERHPIVKNTLEGLDYEIFWGVDGSKLDLQKIHEAGLYDSELSINKIPYGKELTRGEIGCALSHLNVYKDIIKNGYQNALILEDDLAVANADVEKLSKALDELPENWDLLYLGYLYNNNEITLPIIFRIYFAYPILNMIGYKKYNPRKLKCRYPRPYSEHLDLSGYHYGTHAYAVTIPGVKKILTYQTPVTMASDNAIGTMCMEENINAFRVKKRIFHQNRKLPTSIEGRYD